MIFELFFISWRHIPDVMLDQWWSYKAPIRDLTCSICSGILSVQVSVHHNRSIVVYFYVGWIVLLSITPVKSCGWNHVLSIRIGGIPYIIYMHMHRETPTLNPWIFVKIHWREKLILIRPGDNHCFFLSRFTTGRPQKFNCGPAKKRHGSDPKVK